MTDKILILDFGSQVTQLIARRVRENGVYCEIQPYTVGEEKIRAFAPRGIILSGGPASVTVATTPRAPDIVFRLGVPVLTICYGMQTMCAQLGGRVTLSDHQEFGRAFIEILGEGLLFDGLGPPTAPGGARGRGGGGGMGPRSPRCHPASAPLPPARARPMPRSPMTSAAYTGCCST